MERKIIRIGSLNSESQQQKEIPLEVELKNEIELCNKWTNSSSYHFKHLVERHYKLLPVQTVLNL